ncbi:hypothetical protein [[Mycoplasma] gypis]|uniref:Uncharacterized protein n=1 Tax=[Mycoplasma] gypis TaxID=92404 RepID=A0ABZ2RV36_9BACT|nr:hypothetical protein [[Mycoplasma] gypis]MBN0919456.1 hypothetical protein [[Mycoplasma] gypis]
MDEVKTITLDNTPKVQQGYILEIKKLYNSLIKHQKTHLGFLLKNYSPEMSKSVFLKHYEQNKVNYDFNIAQTSNSWKKRLIKKQNTSIENFLNSYLKQNGK